MGSSTSAIYSSTPEFSSVDFIEWSEKLFVSADINLNKCIKQLEIRKCNLRKGFSFLSKSNEKWKHHYVLISFTDGKKAAIDKTEQGVFVYQEFLNFKEVRKFMNPSDYNHQKVQFDIGGVKKKKYNRFDDDVNDLTLKKLLRDIKSDINIIDYDPLVTRFNCVGFSVKVLQTAFIR